MSCSLTGINIFGGDDVVFRILNCSTLNAFKKRLDVYMNENVTDTYGMYWQVCMGIMCIL